MSAESVVQRNLIRAALVAAVLVVAWRAVVLGMSAHYGAQVSERPEATEPTLAWGEHSKALWVAAMGAFETEPDRAEALLRRAVAVNPANGRALVTLGRLWQREGAAERADRAVTLGTRLRPASTPLRLETAQYWVERGRLERAVADWGVALAREPSLRERLFPVLLKIAEDPQARPALAVLADEPPEWWDRFFAYAVRRAVDIETAHALYGLRSEAEAVLSARERQSYLRRLEKEQRWGQAYMAWLNSLEAEGRSVLGNLYNGGFERELSDVGFGWHTPGVDGAVVNTARTYGVSGERALHVVFQGETVRFRHLFQPLYLAPGTYRLKGKVRPASLDAAMGVQWVVRCRGEQRRTLATSERFVGTDQWRRFQVAFAVPAEGCPSQELRLEALGERPQDFQIQGEIWFDGMAIQAVSGDQ